MKIFLPTAAFIFLLLLPSAAAKNVSRTRKLSNETQLAYGRTVSYAGQSVISCDADGLFMSALDSLHRDHDVIKAVAGHIHIRVKSADEKAEIQAIVGSACEDLYDLEDAVLSFERDQTISRQENDWFAAYHNLKEIVQWYKNLASEYPSITKFVASVGKSVEGRNIPAFHVTAGGDDRRKVWIQCQIHAREWISAPTCMYIVHSLVTLYGKDKATTNLLKNAELIVIPIVNPDGYVYTWTNNRLWRKNRSQKKNGCAGTDLNRNYDDHWSSGIGTSTKPCSEIYKGTSAASEPEIASTTAYFLENAPIYGAIDIHSYSQLILSPLGWTKKPSPDHKVFVNLMDKMEKAIESVHKTRYTSMQASGLYPASGTTDDWFYGEGLKTTNGGVRAYALAFELRDTGVYEFELPANQIRPNGEEILPGIMIFIKTAIESPLSYGDKKCVDTKVKFKLKNGQKNCKWVAKKTFRTKKYCKKKTKFFDDNKKAFICTRCCKACSESKCDT